MLSAGLKKASDPAAGNCKWRKESAELGVVDSGRDPDLLAAPPVMSGPHPCSSSRPARGLRLPRPRAEESEVTNLLGITCNIHLIIYAPLAYAAVVLPGYAGGSNPGSASRWTVFNAAVRSAASASPAPPGGSVLARRQKSAPTCRRPVIVLPAH